jgi:hypothetical protein
VLCTLTDMVFVWIGDREAMFDSAVSLHEVGELGITPDEIDNSTGVSKTSEY